MPSEIRRLARNPAKINYPSSDEYRQFRLDAPIFTEISKLRLRLGGDRGNSPNVERLVIWMGKKYADVVDAAFCDNGTIDPVETELLEMAELVVAALEITRMIRAAERTPE